MPQLTPVQFADARYRRAEQIRAAAARAGKPIDYAGAVAQASTEIQAFIDYGAPKHGQDRDSVFAEEIHRIAAGLTGDASASFAEPPPRADLMRAVFGLAADGNELDPLGLWRKSIARDGGVGAA